MSPPAAPDLFSVFGVSRRNAANLYRWGSSRGVNSRPTHILPTGRTSALPRPISGSRTSTNRPDGGGLVGQRFAGVGGPCERVGRAHQDGQVVVREPCRAATVQPSGPLADHGGASAGDFCPRRSRHLKLTARVNVADSNPLRSALERSTALVCTCAHPTSGD